MAFIATRAVYQAMDPGCSRSSRRCRRRSPSRTRAENPLTLANGFVPVPAFIANTFAVDPDFRVGYCAQLATARAARSSGFADRDRRPISARRGSHLLQEFLPNTYPLGATNPCPACPAGFVYLTSDGSSTQARGAAAVAPAAAQRPERRRRSTPWRRRPTTRQRRLRGEARRVCDRAGLARSRRRARTVELRSAPSVGRAVPVHDRRWASAAARSHLACAAIAAQRMDRLRAS